MTEILAEQLETEQSMFVQTAQGIESDGANLTLQGITPSTLFFSDRPQRVVGHMATTDFVDLWAVGDNSFDPFGRPRRPSRSAVCVGVSDAVIGAGCNTSRTGPRRPAASPTSS